MVRKVTGILLAIGCTMTIIASAAISQDAAAPRIATTVDATYLTKYVWRGLVLDNDAVLQSSIKLGFPGGLSYKLMLNNSTNSTAVAGKISRAEHTLDYPTQFLGQKLNVGYTYYADSSSTYYPTFFVAGQGTSEVYTNFSFGGKFNPTVCLNYDVDKTKGLYATVGGSYSVAVPVVKSLDFSARVGFGDDKNNQSIGEQDSSHTAVIDDLFLGVSTTYSLGGSFTLVPSISYTKMLNKEIKNQMFDPSNTIVGVSMQSSF